MAAKSKQEQDQHEEIDEGAVGGAAAVAGIAALVLAGPIVGVAAAGGAAFMAATGAPSKNRRQSNKIFQELDVDNSSLVTIDEMAKFVQSNHKMYAMVAVTLDYPDQVAAKVVTLVAMELATGLVGDEALETELTRDQFHQFRKKYVLDPAGSRELFHRAIFATFDSDNTGTLDEEELDQCLYTLYYKEGCMFQGNLKLPPTDVLRRLFVDKLANKKDKKLSFNVVRRIISGEAALAMANEIEKAAIKAEAEEKARKEAVEKAKKEAKEKAELEASNRALKEAEEKQARREAEEQARREAEEQARKEEYAGHDFAAMAAMTFASVAGPSYGQSSKQFSLFQWIVDIFVPPQPPSSQQQKQTVLPPTQTQPQKQAQQSSQEQYQLIQKQDNFCIIL